MTKVTTYTIVDQLQEVVEEIKNDKKLDLEKRVKMTSSIVGLQLRAGALQLQFMRAVAKLPEEASTMLPQLSTPPASDPAAAGTH